MNTTKFYEMSYDVPESMPRPKMTIHEIADFMRSNPDVLELRRDVWSGPRRRRIVAFREDNFQELRKKHRVKEASWEALVEREIAALEKRFSENTVEQERPGTSL